METTLQTGLTERTQALLEETRAKLKTFPHPSMCVHTEQIVKGHQIYRTNVDCEEGFAVVNPEQDSTFMTFLEHDKIRGFTGDKIMDERILKKVYGKNITTELSQKEHITLTEVAFVLRNYNPISI